jgi:uncharacterized protein with PQ loop repeat
MTRQHHQKHISKIKRHQKSSFDYIVYFFTIATPLFELPQAITIFAKHDAGSVSIYTWGFFLIDNVVWIIYALRRRLMPLLVTSILYLVIEIGVVVGIVLYS